MSVDQVVSALETSGWWSSSRWELWQYIDGHRPTELKRKVGSALLCDAVSGCSLGAGGCIMNVQSSKVGVGWGRFRAARMASTAKHIAELCSEGFATCLVACFGGIDTKLRMLPRTVSVARFWYDGHRDLGQCLSGLDFKTCTDCIRDDDCCCCCCCMFVPAGMANILAAMAQYTPQLISGPAITSSSILPMKTAEDLEAWERLDDVIMVRCDVMASVSFCAALVTYSSASSC